LAIPRIMWKRTLYDTSYTSKRRPIIYSAETAWVNFTQCITKSSPKILKNILTHDYTLMFCCK